MGSFATIRSTLYSRPVEHCSYERPRIFNKHQSTRSVNVCCIFYALCVARATIKMSESVRK
jgi:hypothetical protein